jgi:PAS domain S-box-containing protein
MESKNSAPLASYIDLLPDAVCAVDKQGRFVFVSAACEQVFGYTPDELIGQAMIDLVHPADRQRTLDAAREIMGGEPKLNFENRYLRKDGRVVHILWSARWSEVNCALPWPAISPGASRPNPGRRRCMRSPKPPMLQKTCWRCSNVSICRSVNGCRR